MTEDVVFQAMGCRSRVVVNGSTDEGLAAWAIERLEQIESAWSRFRLDSEVTALNSANGALTSVSPDTYALFDHALHGFDITGGLFDPTMLNELKGHGYDRSYGKLAPPTAEPAARSTRSDSGRRAAGVRVSRCHEIVCHPELVAVVLPQGVSFDPGGVGKGLAADIVATELIGKGASGAMIDLGGDVRVAGNHPDDGAVWTIRVDDPAAPGEERFRLGLADGGIATSSQVLRRWATDHGDRHHLLDAQTGDPSESPVAAAVVASGAAWKAEVLAKAALLAGFEEGAHLIAEHHAVGVLFDFDGRPADVGMLANATVSDP